jgi:hypothetical protein
MIPYNLRVHHNPNLPHQNPEKHQEREIKTFSKGNSTKVIKTKEIAI